MTVRELRNLLVMCNNEAEVKVMVQYEGCWYRTAEIVYDITESDDAMVVWLEYES